MREYAVVLLTAALVTFLATPVVRMVAIRLRMMAAPRERDVHVIPTPRGGGATRSQAVPERYRGTTAASPRGVAARRRPGGGWMSTPARRTRPEPNRAG